MSGSSPKVPPYIRRALLTLIIVLISVSTARLLVTMHQQQERISILEQQVAQLLADTTRLQLPVYAATPSGQSYTRDHYRQSSYVARSSVRARDTQPASPSSGQPATSAPTQTGSDTAPPRTPSQSHKFTEPHLFDLNTIDSATLVRIPGIAERTASVILRYRERYGGFHNVDQLGEFLTWDAAQAYLPEWCTEWFTVDARRLRQIPINTATVAQLQHHPYISHEQAIDIVQYRRRHKRFDTPTQLQQLSTFTAQQYTQLLPYISFE